MGFAQNTNSDSSVNNRSRFIDAPSSLEINTRAVFYSNRVPSAALYRVMGGSFSNKLIDKTSERIGGKYGTVQGESSIGVLFNDNSHTVLPSKTGWWALDYGFTNLYSARFNQDAFNLIFRGNAPFAGTTLRSENLTLNSMSWNSLGASFTKPLKRPGGVISQLSVGASWVFMREYNRISLPQASLFTSGLGDSLHLTYALDCTRKDKNAFGFYPLSHGASVNLRYFSFKQFRKNLVSWSVSVRDLGLVSLGSAAARYAKDSAIGINGWNVPFTPYGIDSNASFSNYFDTLLNRLNPQRTPQNMFVAMPALLSCSASVYYRNGARLFGSVVYRAFPGFIPRATIGYAKNFAKYSYGAQLSLGGVSSGDLGAFASWTPVKSFYLSLEVNALEGLIAPMQAGGAGGRVMLVWNL
ncbi:MAG: hypothetical protein KJS92_05825 [Bacteroidetes bacterium]|nr:hypothetical protein [Bacteroidota bacterium]